MADRLGQLSASRTASEDFLGAAFDPVTERLQLPREGTFWQAVQTAHDRGWRGRGRRIAILDAGFDLSIDRLRRAASPQSVIRAHTIRRKGRHGTAVALLASEVAPEAELLLLDVEPSLHLRQSAVAEAVSRAVELGADVINLSLEFPSDCPMRDAGPLRHDLLVQVDPPREEFLEAVHAWRTHADPYQEGGCRWDCQLCEAMRSVPPTTTVLTAAGNVHDRVCPACWARNVGVGFHVDTLSEGAQGLLTGTQPVGGADRAWQIEVSVPKPPGFATTSFAAPLLAGFAALPPQIADVERLARCRFAFSPLAQLAMVHRLDPAAVPAQAISTLHQGILAYSEIIPEDHRHWQQDWVRDSCPTCAMFLMDWYDALITLLIVTGEEAQAVPIARIASLLAPRSATTAGNLGEGLWRWAQHEPEGSSLRASRLQEAEQALSRAVELAPQVAMYAEGLAKVRRFLGR